MVRGLSGGALGGPSGKPLAGEWCGEGVEEDGEDVLGLGEGVEGTGEGGEEGVCYGRWQGLADVVRGDMVRGIEMGRVETYRKIFLVGRRVR